MHVWKFWAHTFFHLIQLGWLSEEECVGKEVLSQFRGINSFTQGTLWQFVIDKEVLPNSEIVTCNKHAL